MEATQSSSDDRINQNTNKKICALSVCLEFPYHPSLCASMKEQPILRYLCGNNSNTISFLEV